MSSYAQALRIAADLADENAELHSQRDALLARCQAAETERDAAQRGLLSTQAEVERLTKELDETRKSWAESLTWQAPTNSRIAGSNHIIVGSK
jgi:chromosome segregation ATPase